MPQAPGGGDHPVVNVNWHDAAAYAKWAEAALPTEAQWEKAARGTDGRKYPWGSDWNKSNGNFGGQTAAVGSFPADQSPYGCMDMSGNVREWVSSKYSGGEDLNDQSARRVIRGGCFYAGPRRPVRAGGVPVQLRTNAQEQQPGFSAREDLGGVGLSPFPFFLFPTASGRAPKGRRARFFGGGKPGEGRVLPWREEGITGVVRVGNERGRPYRHGRSCERRRGTRVINRALGG